MEQPEDKAALIPDDVLEDILAASRCVCKAWRAVVDSRRLLRPDLLPLLLGGIFVNFKDGDLPAFFRRPSAGPAISAKLNYLDDCNGWDFIQDHCNGLLLLNGYVVNPATRGRWRWAPTKTTTVFDPTVSPYYQFCSCGVDSLENQKPNSN